MPVHFAYICIVASAIFMTMTLQGCGDQSPSMRTQRQSTTTPQPQAVNFAAVNDNALELRKELKNAEKKLAILEAEKGVSCQQKCEDMALYGRWHTATYGHLCFDESESKIDCVCTSTPEAPPDCSEEGKSLSLVETSSDQKSGKADTMGKLDAKVIAAEGALGNPAPAPALLQSSMQLKDVSTFGHSIASNGEVMQAVHAHGKAVDETSDGKSADETSDIEPNAEVVPGTVRETVGQFCDGKGLREMQGQGQRKSSSADQDATGSAIDQANTDTSTHQLESAILADVANELEKNNVDKMAKEIFTFYTCVRWVPDKTFWRLAEQEMAANIVSSVVDHKEKPNQAIAELYQNFKFVPLLCSRNLEVFGEKHLTDRTYFRRFQEKVDALSQWVGQSRGTNSVGDRLQEIDEVFCGEGTKMNDCKFTMSVKDLLNKVSFFGHKFKSKDDKWNMLVELFQAFEEDSGGNDRWKKDVAEWKSSDRFPFHSFINKNEALAPAHAPKPDERFLICFGKRVASELHRRPSGRHLLTDQNNIGCHGWWNEKKAADMLQRLARLWRPPTCQLADMTYTMKREILAMFSRMNQRLFDALPTMLTDEFLADEGKLDDHIAGPAPFDPKSKAIDGNTFVDSMRVASREEMTFGPKCDENFLYRKTTKSSECLDVKVDYLGSVVFEDGELKVMWDADTDHAPLPVAPEKLRIMPHTWTSPKGVAAHLKDLVAGVGQVMEKANAMFGSMFQAKYEGLAAQMSGSVSKWVVCPVKKGVDENALDSHLGVEDAAFQDFQKEAYAKWTKYKAKIPGDVCEKPSFIDDVKFSRAEMCEISELHADHVEKYTLEDGITKEKFICPMKPSLPPDEQLSILQRKKGKCLLRMTDDHMRHYSWQYQGDYPARRQHERKPNVPQQEYELMKLLKVSGQGASSEASYGRYCTVEELHTTPRFCEAPTLHNPWMSAEEIAQSLADAATGALGIGSSAITAAIGLYQSGLKNRSAKEHALAIGEYTWDKLTGAGRLLHTSAQAAVSEVVDGLPGAGRRHAELERRLFGADRGGLALHSLSFQRSIGADGKTSNSKERFQRYVVTYPCSSFDPVIRYQIGKYWGDAVLRMTKEAFDTHGKHVLSDQSHLELIARGEATLFEKEHDKINNTHGFEYHAALQWVRSGDWKHTLPPVRCRGNWLVGCEPKDRCVVSGLSCVMRTEWSPNDWWAVKDGKLANVVGGRPLTTGKKDLDSLYGIRASVHCGTKLAFGHRGIPESADGSLLDCLQRGVRANSVMRSLEPWKLYFPEEVVVVVLFQEVVGRRCQPSGDIGDKMRALLCASNATEESGGQDAHVKKKPSIGKGAYMGLHTGAGFPRGAPSEVVLRPEDVLEAVGVEFDR